MATDSSSDNFGLDSGARLAAERKAEQDAAQALAPGPPRLDPPFPYVMESWDPGFLET